MADVKKVILILEMARGVDRSLACGIARYSRLHGPWSFYSDPGGRQNSIPKLKNWGAHGIIAHNPTDTTARKIIASGLPAVTRGLTIPNCPHISADSGKIVTMACQHFIQRGFTRFAFCGFNQVDWSDERKTLFEKQVRQAGYSVEIYQSPHYQRRISVQTEQGQLAKWLQSLPKPIGLFTCNDDRARQIVEAGKITGINIPEEVAVLGVDNDPQICELSDPPLSSIVLDFEKTGFLAAELLDRMMCGKSVGELEIVTLPTHVVTRQSTHILAIEDPELAAAINFIRNHAREPIGVDNVVRATCLSRRILEKRFRQLLKRSIYDEIVSVKLHLVAEMLVSTNLSIAEIARNAGYPSDNHFSRSFSKIMGITPLQYRKIHRI